MTLPKKITFVLYFRNSIQLRDGGLGTFHTIHAIAQSLPHIHSSVVTSLSMS